MLVSGAGAGHGRRRRDARGEEGCVHHRGRPRTGTGARGQARRQRHEHHRPGHLRGHPLDGLPQRERGRPAGHGQAGRGGRRGDRRRPGRRAQPRRPGPGARARPRALRPGGRAAGQRGHRPPVVRRRPGPHLDRHHRRQPDRGMAHDRGGAPGDQGRPPRRLDRDHQLVGRPRGPAPTRRAPRPTPPPSAAWSASCRSSPTSTRAR